MDKIIFKKVGHRLKQARELRNITLEEAGKKVDVHKSTVLRWENGETEKIKIPIIETLAIFYNVNPTWLMGYDVPMENKKENNEDDFRYASYGGEDEELDEEDKEKIRAFVEFLKTQKKQKNNED